MRRFDPHARMPSIDRRRWLGTAIATAVAATGIGGYAFGADTSGPVILVLGDSLSAGYGLPQGTGWVDLLTSEMARATPAFKVVNASVSGETTLGGRNRLPALLAQHRPAVVVIELGANDGLRGTDLATTRRHLEAIVAAAQGAGARTLVIGMRLPPNYGPQYTQGFFDLFGAVAKRTGSGHVPFLLDGIAENRAAFQEDGIHPRADVQPRLLDNVRPALLPLLAPAPPAAKPKKHRA